MSRWFASAVFVAAAAGCAAHAPAPAAQASLEQHASATLAEMQARDPGLGDLMRSATGYAVFPDVGAAGALIAGGAFGKGILYEHGVPTGYVEVRQGSVGPQLGGQTYAELIVLRDPYDIDRLKAGAFDLGAGATAVALDAGASASVRLTSGATVFVLPRGGLMAGVSISGQQVVYRPLTG